MSEVLGYKDENIIDVRSFWKNASQKNIFLRHKKVWWYKNGCFTIFWNVQKTYIKAENSELIFSDSKLLSKSMAFEKIEK